MPPKSCKALHHSAVPPQTAPNSFLLVARSCSGVAENITVAPAWLSYRKSQNPDKKLRKKKKTIYVRHCWLRIETPTQAPALALHVATLSLVAPSPHLHRTGVPSRETTRARQQCTNGAVPASATQPSQKPKLHIQYR